MVIVYGIKNCSSCKKALKHFSNHAIFVDIRENPLSNKDLKRFLVTFGDKLINTQSRTWHALNSNERALQPLDLLKQFPLLIKRPIIEDSESFKMTIGWNEKVRLQHC